MRFKKIFAIPALLLSLGALTYCSAANTYDPNSGTGPDVIPLNNGQHNSLSGYCLLTFDANGSTFNDTGATSKSFQVRKGLNWNRISENPAIPKDESYLSEPPEGYDCFLEWLTPTNNYIYPEYVFEDENVTLTAKWGEEYHPSTFATDSWDQIIQASELGYDSLLATYNNDFAEHGAGTFVITDLNDEDEVKLKTRYVHIEGKEDLLTLNDETIPLQYRGDWPVRVIGEKHDLIKSSLKNRVAPLTFEFVHSVNDAIAWDFSKDPGHMNWNDSTVRDYLNTYFFYQLDDQLASGIQTVIKQTDSGARQDKIESSDDQIFLPSFNEMVYNSTSTLFSKFENSTYDYYSRHSSPNDLLKIDPYNNKPISVWLRSPSLGDTDLDLKTSNIGVVVPKTDSLNDLKVTIEQAVANKAYGICPCFSVGSTNAIDIDFSGEGLELVPVDNYALSTKDLMVRIKAKDTAAPYDVPIRIKDGDISLKRENGVLQPLVQDEDFDYSYATGIINFKKDVFSGSNYISLVFNLRSEINKFKAASWDELISIADEGGIHELKNVYLGGDQEKSFVGLEKYITIGSANYRTRVIGESHDTLENDVGLASLTFEFVDALEDPHEWDGSQMCEGYADSSLNVYLSSLVSQNEIMQKFKSVEKPLGYDETCVCKLFPLSLAEYAKSTDPYEGKPYEYYLPTNNERDKYHKYHDGEFIDYWTRTTVDYSMTGPMANYINKDGKVASDSIIKSHYVTPGFAIGFNNVDTTIKFSGTNYTVNGESPDKVVFEVESGKTSKVDDIIPVTQAGVTSSISRDDINITSGRGEVYTDWDLVTLSTDPYRYSIEFRNIPTSGLTVNIVPTDTTAYFCATLMDDTPTNVLFGVEDVFEEYKPETYLSYTFKIDPIPEKTVWTRYKYGESILLDPNGYRNVYFKATGDSGDAQHPFVNKTFSKSQDEGFYPGSTYGTLFKVDSTVEERKHKEKIAISGNIMTLLGDGVTVPTTIEEPGAFYYMFSNIEEADHSADYDPRGIGDYGEVYDASGLILPATGVADGLENDKKIWYTYGYMFYLNDSLIKGPASIAGFNDYKNADVAYTYSHMFAGYHVLNPTDNDIYMQLQTMPKCDFTNATKGMCESMFEHNSALTTANNKLSDDFINDFAESSFNSMFKECTALLEGPTKIGSKANPGEDLIIAENNCCYEMFKGCVSLLLTPYIACDKAGNWSFANAFCDCPQILTAYLDFDGFETGAESCFYCLFGYDDEYIHSRYNMQDLYLYSLELSEWPLGSQNIFLEWLLTQDEHSGTMHCTIQTALALYNAGASTSTIPASWTIETL